MHPRVVRESESEIPSLTYWAKAEDKRYPWARNSTRDAIRQWILEAEHADLLTEAGEKVYPLLLSGETRCGKTSTMCALAAEYFALPAYRMSIGSIVESFMGATTRNLKAALEEAMHGPTALWIMDEVDGIMQQRCRERSGGGAMQEMNAAISVALSMIENLPQHLMLVATTNEPDIIDRAMVARFRHVKFPGWSELDEAERRAFAKSHQLEQAWEMLSYAEVVQAAREHRVRKIIEGARRKP